MLSNLPGMGNPRGVKRDFGGWKRDVRTPPGFFRAAGISSHPPASSSNGLLVLLLSSGLIRVSLGALKSRVDDSGER